MRKKMFVFVFAACAAISSVFADGEEYTTITVDNTAPAELSTWLSGNGYTSLDLVTNIVICGSAVMTNSTDCISSYTGRITVTSGSRFVASTLRALGATTGPTYVENGATLEIYWTLANTSANTLGNEHVYFSGSGTDGKGAMYSSCPATLQFVWPKYWHLLGDASIGSLNYNQDLYSITQIDLGGHDLTINSHYNSYDRFGGGTTITDAVGTGNLIINNSVLFEGGFVFPGGAEHQLIFSTNGIYRTNGGFGYADGSTPWTLMMNGPANGIGGFNFGMGHNGYRGPVQLNCATKLQRQSEFASQTFFGPVTGTGSFGTIGNDNSRTWLHLCCPTNRFTGGVMMGIDSVLSLPVEGALPADGGVLTMNAGTVELDDTVTYHLPDFVMQGSGTTYTGLVYQGSGAWKTVTKKESGMWLYRSAVGGDLLDMQAGMIRFPAPAAGLYEGMNATQNIDSVAFATNGVRLLPLAGRFEANTSYMYGMSSGRYTGWIWNRTGGTANWNFAASFSPTCYFYLDDAVVFKATQCATPTLSTNSIAAGKHKFEVRFASGGGTQGTKVNNVYPWGDSFKGFVYDTQGRNSTNSNYYAYIQDPGDGSLLTVCENPEEAPAYPLPLFKEMRFTKGTVLDLCGNAYTACEISGWPVVTNMCAYTAPACGLTITNTFTVAGGEIASKAPMNCYVPLTFTAGATVTLTNATALSHATVKEYTICSCPNGISGTAQLITDDSGWHIRKAEDSKSLSLFYATGTLIKVM